MYEEGAGFRVVTRKSLGWIYGTMAFFGLLSLASVVSAALWGTGAIDRAQGERLIQALDRLRDGPWPALGLFVLVLAGTAMTMWYTKPRRRDLELTGNRLRVDGREYALPQPPARPGRWSHRLAGTLGSVLALRDTRGTACWFGLKNLVLPDAQYGPHRAEDCVLYLETEEASRRLVDYLANAGLVDLGAETAMASPNHETEEKLCVSLVPSTTRWKTWVPLIAAFSLGAAAVSFLAMTMRDRFGAPDNLAYAVTLVGIFLLIGGIVWFGNQRLAGGNLRLEIDADKLTVRKGQGRVVVRRLLAELRFETPEWLTYTRYGGSYYVGPALGVHAGRRRLVRLGMMEPSVHWITEQGACSSCDYVLGLLDWKRAIERLGLAGQLARKPLDG